jgi:hypothetical protein
MSDKAGIQPVKAFPWIIPFNKEGFDEKLRIKEIALVDPGFDYLNEPGCLQPGDDICPHVLFSRFICSTDYYTGCRWDSV